MKLLFLDYAGDHVAGHGAERRINDGRVVLKARVASTTGDERGSFKISGGPKAGDNHAARDRAVACARTLNYPLTENEYEAAKIRAAVHRQLAGDNQYAGALIAWPQSGIAFDEGQAAHIRRGRLHARGEIAVGGCVHRIAVHINIGSGRSPHLVNE